MSSPRPACLPYRLNQEPVAARPPRPPRQSLTGRFISLVPLTEQHTDFTALYTPTHGHPERAETWRFMSYGPFKDPDSMRNFYLRLDANGDTALYLVHHHDDNTLAGMAGYLRIKPEAHSLEIGHIWHAPERRRGRANTETAFLLMEQAFRLGYRRVEWKCNAINQRSRQAALRLGFAFEGVFRQHMITKGRNRDTAWFSIIDKDWPRAKQHLQEWLDPKATPFSLARRNLPLVQWSIPAHDSWPTN